MVEPANIPSSLTLPAVLRSLPRFIEFVRSAGTAFDLDEKKVSEIELATEEAIVNIINYGYGNSPGDIEITCSLEKRDLLFEIIDSGVPFNPLAQTEPDVNADIDERSIGGLGIYLTEKLMDNIRYRREEEKNILTLVVRKPSTAPVDG